MAIWQLRASADQRARQLARAAMILSLVGLVVQAITYEALSDGMMKDIDHNMKASMQAAFSNDYSKCVIAGPANPLASTPRAAPTAEQVQTFSNLAKQRYGELRDISVISLVSDGGLWNVTITAAITVRLSKRETTGSAMFQLIPQTNEWIPATRLLELTVDDPILGDLILSPTPLPTPTNPPSP